MKRYNQSRIFVVVYALLTQGGSSEYQSPLYNNTA